MSMGVRVTYGAMTRAAQRSMSTALTRVSDAQNAIITGKRINRASDDPGGAAQVMRLNDAIGDIKQYMRNGDEAKNYLALTDSALDSTGTLIRKARDITLQAASANNANQEVRNAFAEQIKQIKTQLTGLANSNQAGRYLFAGQKTNTPPFDPNTVPLTYQGDTGTLRAEINRGEYVNTNVTGDTVFSQLFTDLDTLEADIRAGNVETLSQTGVASMTSALDRVLEARGRVGATINQIDQTKSRLSSAQQEFDELRANTEEIDVAEAIVGLQAAQNAYQAALGATGRSFQDSLMDYLR